MIIAPCAYPRVKAIGCLSVVVGTKTAWYRHLGELYQPSNHWAQQKLPWLGIKPYWSRAAYVVRYVYYYSVMLVYAIVCMHLHLFLILIIYPDTHVFSVPILTCLEWLSYLWIMWHLFIAVGEIETQGSSADTLIINILAPLMGVLIFLILLVIVVIIPLISIIYLRMRYCMTITSNKGMLYEVFVFSYRKFSHNWQAYGNPDLVCVLSLILLFV